MGGEKEEEVGGVKRLICEYEREKREAEGATNLVNEGRLESRTKGVLVA